jgi:hypothetical protein
MGAKKLFNFCTYNLYKTPFIPGTTHWPFCLITSPIPKMLQCLFKIGMMEKD